MDRILPEVNKLLNQYQQYKKLLEELGAIERQLAKAKLLGTNQSLLKSEQITLKKELQTLSDAMTFANPIIWIQYKNLAYKDEAQPITTMHDLRVHCSKPDYICTKRYTFLNEYLTKQGIPALSDQATYPDTLELTQLLKTPSLQALVEDPAFLKQWALYEYFTQNGQVAKWENFNS